MTSADLADRLLAIGQACVSDRKLSYAYDLLTAIRGRFSDEAYRVEPGLGDRLMELGRKEGRR